MRLREVQFFFVYMKHEHTDFTPLHICIEGFVQAIGYPNFVPT